MLEMYSLRSNSAEALLIFSRKHIGRQWIIHLAGKCQLKMLANINFIRCEKGMVKS